MKPTIVAFTGLIGSGKTTAAMYLCENYNFRRVRFAGVLKDMSYAFGLNYDQVDGSKREIPCDLLGGKTPREFMQLLGTEFGRNMIDPDIWIKAWKHSIKQVPEGVPIVVDDCRFPNEAEAVRRSGSIAAIYRIVRGHEKDKVATHASELQTFKITDTIKNDSSRDALYKQLDKIARHLAALS